ncbi:hypothetical protein KFK09_024240 [Dendrobium nobile]|uniref:Reverse transcriptase domain-containing protein n=1 Tax=Dendrobium nobile TaxID=94219 RepID=A0A8T3AD97_DENNO|nr:hypothetical protein KFK09_024240 [Dendrobium nobile]
MTLPLIASWNVRGFNCPEKVITCKKLVSLHRLEMLCILEAKITPVMSSDDWFNNSHQIFSNENCCNNFSHASPSRIWLKWNASSISFAPSNISSQLIHGTLWYDSVNCINILVVYAANTAPDRCPLEANSYLTSLHEAKCSWISQRAKARWLSNRDDDLGFLYARIKSRKNTSHIKEITTDEGFFTNHAAVCDGSSSSAPSPDGYNFEFYKKAWPLINTQICKAVKFFFQSGTLPKRAKATAIALIPKGHHASNISDFRPISLCNIFYKIIAKILTNRMKDIMPHIIHKSQAGFVQGRVSTDNIILASEILGCFNSAPIDKFFCAKLDIKKVFDTVSREFLLTPSGLFINHSKCSILFSYNTPHADDINLLLGFLRANGSRNYLGLPISSKKLNSTYFLPLLSKLLTLLAGWKNRFLSFAGRLQFLKFSIANTLAYWIRGSIIPKSICKLVDKMCSRFLFHGSTNLKKLHLIAWKNTCLPKCFGGLGIPSIESLYFAYACSFIWRMYTQETMVAKWLRHNYLSPWKQPQSKSSKFWKLICSTAVKIKGQVTLNVGNENCLISMFWDPWFKDFIKDGIWDIPDHWGFSAANLIKKVIVLDAPYQPISWMGSEKACFKTFYLYYHRDLQSVFWHPYIWHKRYALCYSSYTWMAISGGLKTAEALAIRNIEVFAGIRGVLFFADASISRASVVSELWSSYMPELLFIAYDSYVAPESVQSKGENVTEKADVYSFGILIMETIF